LGANSHVLLIRDEVDPEVTELDERVHERLGAPREAVVAPDEDNVDFALARQVEELLIVWPVGVRAARVIDKLVGDGEPPAVGVGAQLRELGLRVLTLVEGRDARVDRGAAGALCVFS
jgi:hypothetical protein